MSPDASRQRVAIILAAGKGVRMRSRLPKVLHEVGGRPSLEWVVEGARACGCNPIYVVVGPEGDAVEEAFGPTPDLRFVTQPERLGTGHAVLMAARELASGEFEDCTSLILYGDAPLVTTRTLERLLSAAEGGFAALSMATLEEPGSLGRVACSAPGQLERIVEVADASPADLTIKQVNAGHYAVTFPAFRDDLERLTPANAQGEFYLTDAFVSAAADRPVLCLQLDDSEQAWGINTREDLARVHDAFCRRAVRRLQLEGVTILSPDTVTIEDSVTVSSDVVIHANVTLLGATEIQSDTVIHSGSWIKNSKIGERCEIRPYSVLEDATLGNDCGVGPFARLRAGATLDQNVHIGNFVEVKKSRLGRGVKAAHLAYLGDATVGERTNIGAGVVTCNYDGRDKHRTVIGSDAFVGSDTMLIAPVSVGDRATTAAGSVITSDVPDEALAVGRARQRNVADWKHRRIHQRTVGDGVSAIDDARSDHAEADSLGLGALGAPDDEPL